MVANRLIICHYKESCSVSMMLAICVIGYSESWTCGCYTAWSYWLQSWYNILGNYWSEKWEWPCSQAILWHLFIYLLKEVGFLFFLEIMSWDCIPFLFFCLLPVASSFILLSFSFLPFQLFFLSFIYYTAVWTPEIRHLATDITNTKKKKKLHPFSSIMKHE